MKQYPTILMYTPYGIRHRLSVAATTGSGETGNKN